MSSQKRKFFKKGDIIIMMIVAAVALLLLCCSQFLYPAVQNGQVEITVHGNVYGTFPLNENRRLVIEDGNGGGNTVVFQDGTVFVEAADCPDHLCVKQGKISRLGQAVVCLPHGLVVTVKEAPANTVDF